MTPPWVKTSLAPGSRVVTDYYDKAGLSQYLDALRFNTVGYGCTTCIGNSGPLPTDVSKAIEDHGLVAVSVLSGNRNFEGRINSDVRANYLMSPPLVVAYALAGTIDFDFDSEAIGKSKDGTDVYLEDIWPSQEEVNKTVADSIDAEMFRKQYSTVSDGDTNWQALKVPSRRMSTDGSPIPPTSARRRTSTACPQRPRPWSGHCRCACARGAWRFRHDRPHLARRLHQAERPCRQVPDR